MTPSLKLVARYRRLLDGDGRFARPSTSVRRSPQKVRAAIGESRRTTSDAPGRASSPTPATR